MEERENTYTGSANGGWSSPHTIEPQIPQEAQQVFTQSGMQPSYTQTMAGQTFQQRVTAQSMEANPYQNQYSNPVSRPATGRTSNNVNGMAAWYESQKMENQSQKQVEEKREVVKSDESKSAEKKSRPVLKLLYAAAVALVFGLVAGVAFQGVQLASKKINNDKTTVEISKDSGKDSGGVSTEIATTEADKNTENTEVVKTVYDVATVSENVMPSIVAINGTYVQTYEYWFQSYQEETPGAGSGIIIKKDDEYLYVLTNYHVVENAKELSVCFVDDESVSAEVKGYDETHDTAVVKIKLSDIKDSTLDAIKTIDLGDSNTLKVGDPCVAIGNAMGYGQSVTVGYISALEREISVSDGTVKVLQTDAAINPGNSGGALVNMSGQLIGMNTAKYVDSTVEGMGYALPISDIIDIVNNIIDNKETEKVQDETSGDAFLGISGQSITNEYSQMLGMPTGVYVSSVESGSAAEECGLVSGDIIYSFDGEQVSDMNVLHDQVVSHSAGDEVEIKFYRNNNGEYIEQTVTAKLKSK